jgi:hypothetical protein
MGVVYREGRTIGANRESSLSKANGLWNLYEVDFRTRNDLWQQKIVTSGLVLHYDAGIPESYPGSGTSVTDLSGSNITGTLGGGVSYDSAFGGAFWFDGVDDEISTTYDGPNSLFAAANNAWSVEAWFNFIAPASAAGGYGIVNRGGGRGTANTFTIGLAGTGAWSGTARTLNSLCINLRGATTQITAGSLSGAGWRQVVVKWDGAAARAYLNGSLWGTVAVGSAAVQNNVVRIGVYATEFFRNYISNVKMYDIALSDAQVGQNFNALRSRYGI